MFIQYLPYGSLKRVYRTTIGRTLCSFIRILNLAFRRFKANGTKHHIWYGKCHLNNSSLMALNKVWSFLLTLLSLDLLFCIDFSICKDAAISVSPRYFLLELLQDLISSVKSIIIWGLLLKYLVLPICSARRSLSGISYLWDGDTLPQMVSTLTHITVHTQIAFKNALMSDVLL